MSQQYPQPNPFAQPGPVEEPAPKRRRWPWILAIVAAVFVGAIVGSAGASDETSAGTVTPPVPAETVTAEAEVVTETVTEVPQVCLEAFTYADDALDLYHTLAEDLQATMLLDESMTVEEFEVMVADKDELLVQYVTAKIACDGAGQ